MLLALFCILQNNSLASIAYKYVKLAKKRYLYHFAFVNYTSRESLEATAADRILAW